MSSRASHGSPQRLLERSLDVVILGEPLPQGRPRVRILRHGSVVRPIVYDPARSRAWKQQVAWQLRAAAPDGPFAGPLALTAQFWLSVDEPGLIGWYKRPGAPPQRCPDVDNLLKAILDAGNGVWWRDDAQLVLITASKRPADGTPGVRLLCGPALILPPLSGDPGRS